MTSGLGRCYWWSLLVEALGPPCLLTVPHPCHSFLSPLTCQVHFTVGPLHELFPPPTPAENSFFSASPLNNFCLSFSSQLRCSFQSSTHMPVCSSGFSHVIMFCHLESIYDVLNILSLYICLLYGVVSQ